MSHEGYTGVRKRNGNPSAKSQKEKQPKLTLKEQWHQLVDAWRPSNLRKLYNKEYRRVYGNANRHLHTISEKLR